MGQLQRLGTKSRSLMKENLGKTINKVAIEREIEAHFLGVIVHADEKVELEWNIYNLNIIPMYRLIFNFNDIIKIKN